MNENGIEIQQVTDEQWNAHTHEDFEEGQPAHIHVEDASWAMAMNLPIGITFDDDVNLTDLMEFRGVALSMGQAMEDQRAVTDIGDMSLAEAQFTVLAYNTDRMLVDGVVNVVDQTLVQMGVEPPCQLQPVESSNIRSLGFVLVQGDHEGMPDNGTLYVAFKHGGLYRYANVPTVVAQEFVQAESKGAFFQRFIKDEGYAFRKVGG